MTFKSFLLEKRTVTPERPYNNLIVIMGLPGAGKSTIIENQDILSKVVSALLKEENDKKKLIDILRNLNSKHEYA